MTLPNNAALIVVDVQVAFDDSAWGTRNNPEAEANVAQLLAAWRVSGRPILHIQHRNTKRGRRFHPDSPGFSAKPEAEPLPSETVLTKTVNSAFIGTDLEQRLRDVGVADVVVCGLTTDHCVSTTTRMAGNLGFRAVIVSDATATFDRIGPDGRHWTAELMHDCAIASLHQEFAVALTTEQVLAAVDM
jgi:nicotinamidase-related amidase